MGNRIIFYCDRCKKEMDIFEELNTITIKGCNEADVDWSQTYELCDGCLNKLEKFMGNEMED